MKTSPFAVPGAVSGWCLAATLVAASSAWAQTSTPAAPPAARPPASAVAPPGAAAKSARPAWNELTAAQQTSLKPLAGDWNNLSELQKRKWLALSKNFGRMSPGEQAKLHSRMTDWASLSPQQRAQARLNFAESRKLSPDEKKAKWQAYQALSPEQKQKLAAGAPSKPAGAATAIKPTPAQKITAVPVPRAAASSAQHTQHHQPRIATAPHQVDHLTLLPQPAPAPASAQP